MDKDKKTNESHSEMEEKDMTTAILKKSKVNDLKAKLDLLTKKSTFLQGNDDMIELDPNNESHKEWFEKDKYKGK